MSRYPVRIENNVIAYYTNAVTRIYNIGFRTLDEAAKPILEIDSMTNSEYEKFSKKIAKPPNPIRDGSKKDNSFFTRSGNAVNIFSYQKLSSKYQTNILTGVPLEKVIPSARARVIEFADLNTKLIKDIKEESRLGVKKIIDDGFTQGKLTKDIAKELQAKYDIDKNKAEFWATDQVGKLNSNIDEIRMKDAGFNNYDWEDSGDEKVRTSHHLRNGVTYTWGGDLQPGWDYRCRCTAEPTEDEVDPIKQAEVADEVLAFDKLKKDNLDIKKELEVLGFNKVLNIEKFNREKLEDATDIIDQYSKQWLPLEATNSFNIRPINRKKGIVLAGVGQDGIAFNRNVFGKSPKRAMVPNIDRAFNTKIPGLDYTELYLKKGFNQSKAIAWHEMGHMFVKDLKLTSTETTKLNTLFRRYKKDISKGSTISKYSLTDRDEFFAESFTFFIQNKSLKKRQKSIIIDDMRVFILSLQKRAQEKIL